jgi:hypothetical protein
MLDVVMIRARSPDPLEFHRTDPTGDDCGFIFLRFAQEDVEKQCPKAWGEY